MHDWFCTFVQSINVTMKKIKNFFYGAVFLPLIFLLACNPQPAPQQQQENVSEQELEKQSEDFSKSMDNLDEAMDVASQLNERIELVEQRFSNGEISRERADELIKSINQRYGKNLDETSESDIAYVFPAWLTDIGISEPKGLHFDGDLSFQTKEHDIKDGYNSVLFVYHGTYAQAMKEAERIAGEAGVPLTEAYRKARELSHRLGKDFDGLKGVTYANFEIGTVEFNQDYKISINVDDKGKLSLNVVDVKTKTKREKSGSLPKGF